MIFLILCNVIIFILLVCFLKTDHLGNIPVIMAISNLLFLGLSLFFFLQVEIKEPSNDKEIISSKEIYSLDLSKSNEGSFYLGSGNISEDMKYYYYIKNDDGTYKLENEKAKNVNIHLIGDNENPKIVYESKAETKIKKTMPEIFNKLSINKLFGADGEWKRQGRSIFYYILPGTTSDNEKVSITIYIPEGSIKNNYDPNIKK